MANLIDWTIVDSTDGYAYKVAIDSDDVATVIDLDSNEVVAAFAFDSLATVTEALALNIGTGRYLDSTTVANVQQFCRI